MRPRRRHRPEARRHERIRTAAVTGLALCCIAAPEANAQAPSVVDIPLQLMAVNNSYYRLGISVGINGGAPQLYMFDTGSAPFAAAFNPNTWGGFAGQTTVPNSPFPNGNNVFYCYGGGVACSTGNIYGNRLQIRSLSFPAGVTLTANPGYAVEAISQLNYGSTTYSFPSYFTDNPQAPPPFTELFGPFYGVFGAGNFTQGTLGGVLGQTIVSGVTQGYVVAANGQPNPASGVNAPQQVNGINVSVGGQVRAVTSCSPCVTVGLTPQVLGQFAPVGPPGTTGQAGVVPVPSSTASFNNPYVPYGTAAGNNGSTQYGAMFTVSLTAPGASTPAVSSTTGTLLDTGTPSNYLSDTLYNHAVTTHDGTIRSGVTLTAVATTGDGSNTPVPGLTTSTAVMTKDTLPNTYDGSLSSSSHGIIGIGFFLQNSVMYDLSDNVIAYTPFFVTNAALATTANGPLIVDGTNVPLGLAGAVSGPGGVTVGNGGALQLSATNTYTGSTQVASGGRLLVSGPGSIAASSGVVANGVFDISRAWAPVGIQALTGAGQVNLGGRNLTILNAGGTFDGTIADGGAYPAIGGSLTIAGGAQGLSGVNTYTGATTVVGGTLLLDGSLTSDITVGPAGLLSGTGTTFGSLVNAGVVAPGISGSTLTVGGSFGQGASGFYYTQVNGAGQNSRLAVAGAAELRGGTVLASATPGSYAARTTYNILKAEGGVTGTFSSVLGNMPFLIPSLSYDANDVYLTLLAGNFSSAAQNRTQAAVAGVLDVSAPTASGDFSSVLGTLAQMNPAQVAPALTALSGQNYSSFASSMVQGAQLFMSNFSSQAGIGSSRVALAEACDAACDSPGPALWGAWGGGLGGFGTVGVGTPAGAVTYNIGGFAAGLDRQVTPNLRLGVTTGYTTGSQWTQGFQGNGRSNTLLAGLYGNYGSGPVHVDAMAGYAYSDNQMVRTISFPGVQRTARGQAGADQFYGQLEAGYRFDLGGMAESTVTPFARLQAYTANQSSFSEWGAQSLDLTVQGQTTNSVRSVLGARFGSNLELGLRDKLGLQARLGWSHEYADTARPVTAALAGAPTVPFTTYGASAQRDGFLLGLSVSTAVAEAASVYLRYEGNMSGQDNVHALTAGLRMTW